MRDENVHEKTKCRSGLIRKILFYNGLALPTYTSEPLHVLNRLTTLMHVSQSNCHRQLTYSTAKKKKKNTPFRPKTQNRIIIATKNTFKKQKQKQKTKFIASYMVPYIYYHFSKALPSGPRRIALTLLRVLGRFAIKSTTTSSSMLCNSFAFLIFCLLFLILLIAIV